MVKVTCGRDRSLWAILEGHFLGEPVMKQENEGKEKQPCQPHSMIRDGLEIYCATCGEKFRQTSAGYFVPVKHKPAKKTKTTKEPA
jgi:hypothetical protein